jgi:hypothetical protein
MPEVGFQLTISVFEGAKTVHALDEAATVIGGDISLLGEILYRNVIRVSYNL